MGFLPKVAQGDGEEIGVVAGSEDRKRVTGEPKNQARQPHLQAEAEGGGHGAIDYGKVPWRTAEQHRLREGLMQGDVKPLDAI